MAKYIKTENGYQETVDSIDTLQNKIFDIDKAASDALEKASIQADWSQFDSTAVDYIKNNPFHKNIQTINFDKSYVTQENLLTNTEVFGITDDKFYRVYHGYDDICYFLGGSIEYTYRQGVTSIRKIVGSNIRVFRSKNGSCAYAIYDYEYGKIIAICVQSGFATDYSSVHRGLYMLYNSDSDYTRSIQRVLNHDLIQYLYGFDNIYNKYGTQYAIEDALKTKVDRQAIENLSTTEYVDEADERVLTEAKAYSDSKFSHKEIITVDHDGNNEGKVIYQYELNGLLMTYARIADVIDPSTIIDASQVGANGDTLTATSEQLVTSKFGNNLAVAVTNAPDVPVAFVIYEVTDDFPVTGTYVTSMMPYGYVSRIRYQVIIHKIDTKFLPEGSIGYTEPDTVVTYDGNKEGKEIIVFDDELVRISSTVYDFNNLEKLITNGQESTSEIWTVIEEAGAQFLVPQGYDVALFLSASAETLASFGVEGSGGVYINNAFSGFVLALYFHGAIHPIDPKYLPDGMGGYTEKPPAITFDGKPSPDAVFVDDTMLMISEKVYDINSIERITANINGETVVVDKSEMFVSDGVSLVGTVNGDQYTFVAILPYAIADSMGVEKGTYILYDDAVDGEVKVYTAKVEFSETIHPIDPKYLPTGGVGYTETKEVLTNDKNNEGKETFLADGVTYAVIGGRIDVKSIAKVYVETERYGNFTLPLEAFTLLENGGMTVASVDVLGGLVAFWITGTATIVISDSASGMFITRIETETIHPIDPKFLPDTVATKADIIGAMEASY